MNNFRTLNDYISDVYKKESKNNVQTVIQANYEFITKEGLRIPCHNMATVRNYMAREAVGEIIK